MAFGLILGALVRVLALPLPGTGDVEIWKVWSFAATHDVTGVYGVGGTPPERRMLHWQGQDMTVDYPPLSIEQLALVGRLYATRHPLFEDSPALNAVVKLPGLAAEIGFLVVVLTWGRRRFGAAPAAWTAPAVVAALLWRPARDRVRMLAQAAGGGAAVALAVLLPFLLRGAWANIVQAVGRLATHDMMSGNAANIWWIATWLLRVVDVAGERGWWPAISQQVRILGISRAIALGYPNPRVIGLVLVALASAWVMWRMRRVRTLGDAAALAGWLAFAYAQLAAQVHENHLYLALPFLALAGGLSPRHRAMFWWVSGLFALNLLFFEGLGRGMPQWLDRRWTGIDASVILAMISFSVFVWMTAALARSSQKPEANF